MVSPSWRMTLLTRGVQRDRVLALMSLEKLLVQVAVPDLGRHCCSTQNFPRGVEARRSCQARAATPLVFQFPVKRDKTNVIVDDLLTSSRSDPVSIACTLVGTSHLPELTPMMSSPERITPVPCKVGSFLHTNDRAVRLHLAFPLLLIGNPLLLMMPDR